MRAAVDENVHAAFLKRRGHARRWLRKECKNDVTECVECCPPPRFCSAHSCWLGGSCFACPVRPSAFQALISPKQITPRCTEATPRLPVRPGRRRLRTTASQRAARRRQPAATLGATRRLCNGERLHSPYSQRATKFSATTSHLSGPAKLGYSAAGQIGLLRASVAPAPTAAMICSASDDPCCPPKWRRQLTHKRSA